MTDLADPDHALVSPRATAGLVSAFAGVTEGYRAAREADRLSRLSDAGLAAEGLTRAQIPDAVFARHFR